MQTSHGCIALNPDVTEDSLEQTIFVVGYTATVRPSTAYTNGVTRELLEEAGIDVSQMGAYELDHLIPLAVGGHPRKLSNLQLQPWFGENSVAKGAYVLADTNGGKPQVLLLATGSEVSLCVNAYEQLKSEGIPARVVSMPSWELFEQQPGEYRESVIPPGVTARVSVEQASTMGWERYVGLTGQCIGMTTFGASAPLKELQKKFGFTPEYVVAAVKEQLVKGRPI